MKNAGHYLTLHAYFLRASLNKKLFQAALDRGETDSPDTFNHLLLWYGCLWVVVEGWRKEQINWPPVTALLRDTKTDLLRDVRNAVFHYEPAYLSSRVEAFIKDNQTVAWVHGLHNAMSKFFLEEDNGDANAQTNPG